MFSVNIEYILTIVGVATTSASTSATSATSATLVTASSRPRPSPWLFNQCLIGRLFDVVIGWNKEMIQLCITYILFLIYIIILYLYYYTVLYYYYLYLYRSLYKIKISF